jgi:hypothetical protein
MDETTIDQEIADMFGELPDTDPVDTDTSESTNTDPGTSDNSSESTENTDANSPSEEAEENNNSENNNSEGDKDPADNTQQDKQSDQTFSAEDKFTNKQNKAFAEMRVQNKEYEQFLMRMAQIAKLDVKNAKEAKEILAARLNETEAKQKQMDPQVLAELEDSRKQIAEMRQARVKEQALAGFAKLKTLHGLSDTDLNNFADELVAKNKNPFEQEMDLVSEYRLANFDKLMEKAREEGRLAEIARSKKAQQSGSNPGTQRSTPEHTGGSEKSIKTVDDLDNFFKGLGL